MSGAPAAEQQAFDFDVTRERREVNPLINDIRQRVELWRGRNYTGVTPISRKLMQHWADPARENRVLFCQREAAETAIYLAEVAGRSGEPDFRVACRRRELDSQCRHASAWVEDGDRQREDGRDGDAWCSVEPEQRVGTS